MVRPPNTTREEDLFDLVGGRGPLLETQVEVEEDPDVLELSDTILQAQLEDVEVLAEPGEPDSLQEENSQPDEEELEEDLDLPVVGEPAIGEVQEASDPAAEEPSTSAPVGEALAPIGDLPGPVRVSRGVQVLPGVSWLTDPGGETQDARLLRQRRIAAGLPAVPLASAPSRQTAPRAQSQAAIAPRAKRRPGHGSKCTWCYHTGHVKRVCPYLGWEWIPCRVCWEQHPQGTLRCPRFPDAPGQPSTRRRIRPSRENPQRDHL